jgi:uncharacterized protein YjbI with pentapeptide repeats
MPWRTEPEIDEERQRYLAKCRTTKPDINKGIYPFRDENGSMKLVRADLEWLLATHESRGNVGPVWWEDEKDKPEDQRREGLDLRGADLHGIDLRIMPLARARGSLSNDEFPEGLVGGESSALEDAAVRLSGANLYAAHLEQSRLREVHLETADLQGAFLTCASLYRAKLGGANLTGAMLDGASLRRAILDEATNLYGVVLDSKENGGVALRDARWGGADLTVVDWESMPRLGDEDISGTRRTVNDYQNVVRGNRQVAVVLRSQGLNEDADRFAYRAQLWQRMVLRRQRKPIRYLGSWFLDRISGYGYRPIRSLYTYALTIGIFALLFWCVTNDVSLTFGWFTNIITWLGMSPPPPSTEHLQGYEAVVVSMTSFHGRGFFQPVQSPGDKVAILAAIEAFFGLLLEIVLIATFTQRFFAR